MKNEIMFNKDGQPTRRKFKIYCDVKRCKNFIIGRWGNGYGCVRTKEGTFDARNQVWYCNNHNKKIKQFLICNRCVKHLIEVGGKIPIDKIPELKQRGECYMCNKITKCYKY